MRLAHSLNRRLNRNSTRLASRMLGGRPRPRRPDDLVLACRSLAQALRLSQRLARADPHLFGPGAARYYRDTVRLAQEQAEIQAALLRVYGPPQPGDPPPRPGVWTQRYVLDPRGRHFRQWFHERYASRAS